MADLSHGRGSPPGTGKEHAIIRARSTAIALSCSLVLAGGLAACSTAKQITTGEKVSTAFDKLGESRSLSLKFSLDATPAQLLALDATDRTTDSSSGDKLTADQAKAVSGLGATLTVSADKPLKDALKSAGASADATVDPALNFSLEVHAGDGKPLVEVRQVSGKDYLRVDLASVAKLSGAGSTADEITGMQGMADSLPAAFAPFKALLKGKWISMDPKALADLGKNLPGQLGSAAGSTPSAAPSLDTATKNKLVKALTGVFEQDVTLTDKGIENDKDHIVVEAPAKKLVEDIEKAVAPIVKSIPATKSIPGLGTAFPTAAPTDLTDGKASADVLINKDGSLSKLSLDLGQLAPSTESGQHLPVSLSFDAQAPVTTAPADATELTATQLQDMVKSFAGGAGTEGL